MIIATTMARTPARAARNASPAVTPEKEIAPISVLISRPSRSKVRPRPLIAGPSPGDGRMGCGADASPDDQDTRVRSHVKIAPRRRRVEHDGDGEPAQ